MPCRLTNHRTARTKPWAVDAPPGWLGGRVRIRPRPGSHPAGAWRSGIGPAPGEPQQARRTIDVKEPNSHRAGTRATPPARPRPARERSPRTAVLRRLGAMDPRALKPQSRAL